jgi:hypothetical protein
MGTYYEISYEDYLEEEGLADNSDSYAKWQNYMEMVELRIEKDEFDAKLDQEPKKKEDYDEYERC